MTEHEQIREERGKAYGDVEFNHTNIARAWHSILCSYYQKDLPPLPPHVACLMFTVFKMVRAAIPFQYNRDDYFDGKNYMDFAREIEEGNQEQERDIYDLAESFTKFDFNKKVCCEKNSKTG